MDFRGIEMIHTSYCILYTRLNWTGLLKHALAKCGLAKRGLVKRGLVKRGLTKRQLGKRGLVKKWTCTRIIALI